MKSTLRITVLLVTALVANYSIVTAKILRVNNNAGVTPVTGVVYATLSAAYDAATAGDTLLIEGSTTSYGNQTLIKKLTIFGTGYFLTANPTTQASLLNAKLGDITYSPGSDNSLISGCTINSIGINADNITIARNYISNATGASASISLNGNNSNLTIKQNAVYGQISNVASKNTGVVIKNNLLSDIEFTVSMTNVLIINNTFVWSYNYYNGTGAAINVFNSTITNNIIWYYTTNVGHLVFDVSQGNTISYNYMNQPVSAWAGTNNLFGQVQPFAVSYVNVNGSFVDDHFAVLAGNPAESSGLAGSQCGMFGGADPYVLSGMPPIPHIYFLDADPAGNSSAPLNVKISVKSQN